MYIQDLEHIYEHIFKHLTNTFCEPVWRAPIRHVTARTQKHGIEKRQCREDVRKDVRKGGGKDVCEGVRTRHVALTIKQLNN